MKCPGSSKRVRHVLTLHTLAHDSIPSETELTHRLHPQTVADMSKGLC